MRIRAALTAASLLGLAAVPSALAHTGHDRRPGATKFDLEVRITHQGGPGYAPAVAVDTFSNQYAVARKDTGAAAYDDRATTAVRAKSWLWTSSDGGKTWSDLDGPVTAVNEQPAGNEPDVTADGRAVYVADGTGGQAVVSRYLATGPGKVTYTGATSVVGAGGTPQVAAHGATVILLTDAPPAAGGGTSVYASHDGAKTFDPAVTLAGSDACTAAVAAKVLVACTDGAGHLLAFTSRDGGRSFTSAPMGSYAARDITVEAPSAVWGSDGVAYALSLDGTQLDADGIPSSNRLTLHRSTDGRSWTARDVGDPDYPGRYEHARLAAGSDGSLGVAAYHLDAAGRGWHVLASVFPPARHAVLEDFASHTAVASAASRRAPGGRLGVAFGPEPRHNRLSVVWTVAAQDAGATGATTDTSALRDVWFVRSQPPDLIAAPLQERTPVGPLPPCHVAGQVKRLGQWDGIRAPSFRAVSGGQPDALTAYAVDAYDPARMYATNGTTLARSLDAGCTWTEVFSLDAGTDGMPAAGTTHITQVLIPEYRNDHRRVVLVLDDTSPQGRPHVITSMTGDRATYVLGDSGLPAAGHPVVARIAAANPDFLYLAVTPAGTGLPSGGLYASEDAGATWTGRTPTAASPPDITVLATDPGAPNSVWLVADGRLMHSTDGGRTLSSPATADQNQSAAGATVTAIDVSHAPSQPARVRAWSGPTTTAEAKLWDSTDGGAHFAVTNAEGLDGPVESAVHGSRPDILAVSTAATEDHPADLYHLHLDDGDWDSLAPPLAPTGPFALSVDRRAHPSYYAMTRTLLLRYAGAEIEPGPPAPLPGGALYADPGRPVPAPVLAPSTLSVSVPVGSSRPIDLSLSVPARPQRVDLYLLVDTSESMKGVLNELRARLGAVATELRTRGIDVWAGVGGYKTDQDPPKYHRYRDIGPVDADLARALRQLDASQGAGLETQLIALHQTVSGEGLAQCTAAGCLHAAVGSTCDVDPTNPLCSVPPGQQADFRDGAVRVVLHATDAGFRNPEGTPRNAAGKPDIDGVAAEFARAGILQVGLVAGDLKFADTESARQDLARFAAGTGARAHGPVDCDGDGHIDLVTGAPLVCPATSSTGVGNAVLNLLAGLPDPGQLQVQAAGPTVTTAAITSAIDLHTPTARTVRVNVLCRREGRSLDVVTAQVSGGASATAQLDVSCEPAPAPRAAPALLAPLALLPALPPAPVPVTPAQPALNPQAQLQVQAQPQPQLQVGLQEEEQVSPVLAIAGDARPLEEGVRIEALSRRRQDVPTPAYLTGLAALTAVATTVAVRRQQPVPVHERVRR
jgi:hypothetical protein